MAQDRVPYPMIALQNVLNLERHLSKVPDADLQLYAQTPTMREAVEKLRALANRLERLQP